MPVHRPEGFGQGKEEAPGQSAKGPSHTAQDNDGKGLQDIERTDHRCERWIRHRVYGARRSRKGETESKRYHGDPLGVDADEVCGFSILGEGLYGLSQVGLRKEDEEGQREEHGGNEGEKPGQWDDETAE